MRAFTLIEVMVALLLFSLVSLALAECLISAQRWQSDAGRWMQATALAEEALERARAGAGSGVDAVGPFRRRWSSDDDGGVRRVDVVVEWDLPSARQLHLHTWVRP